MPKILIVDDHAVVRKGLAQILKDTISADMQPDEAGNGQEALSKAAANDYDLVLLDISLPGRNGLEILKQLRGERPNLPVLIISMHPEEQYAVRALRAGASGYVTKESAPDELAAAVRKVLQGGRYVSLSLAERLASELEQAHHRGKAPHEMLSDREYQIACMIASGKTVSEIAVEIFLSVKTVSTYRLRILQKMHMKNNAEITTYVIRQGLLG
jgi:DNA-binding NarL/FixJ family response regulator